MLRDSILHVLAVSVAWALFGPGAGSATAAEAKAADPVRAMIEADWALQDGLYRGGTLRVEAIAKCLRELGPAGEKLRTEQKLLAGLNAPAGDPRWLALYHKACQARRAARLGPYLRKFRRFVFTKHYEMGGSHYAYTEGQSDAQAERNFRAGTSLCVLEMDGLYGKVHTLVDDRKGVIRDPDVSYDGKRVLFAWKKSDRKDDYHLYELTVDAAGSKAVGETRQITSGLGFADYEAAYLPDGHIVFNSTRCVQTVDCWWTEVSNLYTCDGRGRYLRQVSHDQVHTNFPTVTPDGRVIYTRWDYNDRGQIYPQGLFEMKPDGTFQTELYGNNSWFPTSLLHTRAIPGTGKYVSIFSGHHSRQKGWLGIVDPSRGRQENSGAQLIAPVRETKAVHVDSYGQHGDQFQYPYPLGEKAFLVTMKPDSRGSKVPGLAPHFAVYFVSADGRRELLVADARISCNQPVPLAPRPVPHTRSNLVNYTKDTGIVFLQDIYEGGGLKGLRRGTIERLRVVTLDFRAAGVGSNGNSGPAGGALISTPISIRGAWDVKVVLGSTKVHEDGSACLVVPARKPIYFQALDANGHAAATMRSWLTLQPGEYVSCVGCHENKNTTPPVRRPALALKSPPARLEPFYGPPRGFSFHKEIQPILDKHCIRCHRGKPRGGTSGPRPKGIPFTKKFRTIAAPEADGWRFTMKAPYGAWQSVGYNDSNWEKGRGGFGSRGTPGARVGTTWQTKQIWMRREFVLKEKDKPNAPALALHHDEDVEVYLNGVKAYEAGGFITRYEVVKMTERGACALKVGRNLLAVHCRQTGGGQYVDVAVVDTSSKPLPVVKKPKPKPTVKPGQKIAFSLKGTPGEWSDAYRALADRRVTNWINPQSVPSMLEPYHAGAARSKLVAMLQAGHNKVQLTTEELHKIATWIDLLVPCFGDYTERKLGRAGNEKYARFLNKRKRWLAQERKNIEAYLRREAGAE